MRSGEAKADFSAAGRGETPPLVPLVLGLLAFRLLYLYFMPLDLYPDEAYYWDWSRHPDWGYYSKPPLVAWVIAVFTQLLGHTSFIVKLPSTLLSVVPLFLLPALARRMFGEKEAFWTLAVLAAVPETASLALFMSTDALLFSCWSVALYALWRGTDAEYRGWGWWVLAALAGGVGSLGKQMMLVFIPLALVFLASSPSDRRLFRDPRLWFFVLTPLLFLIPPVLWNMKMNWVTVEHTAHHFAKRGSAFAFLGTSAEFVGSQFLAISPLLFLVFLGVAPCMASSARKDRRTLYLTVFCLIPLSVVLLLSFRQKINLNWPAVFYQSGMVFLAAFGTGALGCSGLASRLRPLFRPAVAVGIALVVVAYALPWALIPFGLDGGKYDTTARMKGWKTLADRTAGKLAQVPRPQQTFILAPDRQTVSILAFYLPGRPEGYRWPGADASVKSQYELWPGPPKGWDALILTGKRFPEDMAAYFESIEPAGEIVVKLGSAGERKHQLYLGRGLKAWPETPGSKR